MTTHHIPVFESRTDPPRRFISIPCGWFYESHDEAWESGWGLSFVEGILIGFKFTGDVLAVEEDANGKAEIPHIASRLGRDQMIDVQLLATEEDLAALEQEDS